MNQKLIKLQLLGSGLLSLVLLTEWAYSQLAARQLQTLLDPREQSSLQAEVLPTIADHSKGSAESYSEIVDRPLFIEGRRPMAEASPSEIGQNQDIGQIDDWDLIGVYNKDKQPTALFRKRNEAKKFLKIGTDQNISGWQLKQIHTDYVLLQQAGQEKSVALRKPRAQTKPPLPSKPTAPPRPPQPAPVAKPIEQAPDENSENINDK